MLLGFFSNFLIHVNCNSCECIRIKFHLAIHLMKHLEKINKYMKLKKAQRIWAPWQKTTSNVAFISFSRLFHSKAHGPAHTHFQTEMISKENGPPSFLYPVINYSSRESRICSHNWSCQKHFLQLFITKQDGVTIRNVFCRRKLVFPSGWFINCPEDGATYLAILRPVSFCDSF